MCFMCCYDEDCYFVFVCKWKWYCSIYLFLYVLDYCKDVGGCSSETCRKCKIFLFCFFSSLGNGLNWCYFNASRLIFNVKIEENFFLLAKCSPKIKENTIQSNYIINNMNSFTRKNILSIYDIWYWYVCLYSLWYTRNASITFSSQL